MSSATAWSKEEEKAFENAIAMHWVGDGEEESEEKWEKIASNVPSKSMEELKKHYEMLVEDVLAIEAGNIPLPSYVGEEATSSYKDSHGLSSSEKRSSNSGYGSGSGFSGLGNDSAGHGGKGGSRQDQERRKGIPWTEDEHRYLFFFNYFEFIHKLYILNMDIEPKKNGFSYEF